MPERSLQTSASTYCLAGVGGCVDALGVLTLGGLFVSHMSGNSASLGADFGHGHWAAGLPHLLAIPVFVAGLFLGYSWLLARPTFRSCAVILFLEAVLLAGFGMGLWVAGRPAVNSPGYYALALLPLLAMGMQNATLRQVGRSVFPTTYVTGVLDALGKASAQAFLEARRWAAGKAAFPAPSLRSVAQTSGIWLSYVTGAISGSAALLFAQEWAFALPVVVLLGLAVRFARDDRAMKAP